MGEESGPSLRNSYFFTQNINSTADKTGINSVILGKKLKVKMYVHMHVHVYIRFTSLV